MKLVLRAADAGASAGANPPGETPAQTIERLTAENKALHAQVAADEERDAERAAEEALIVSKTRAGLTRDQAIAVIKRQKEHDAAVAAEWTKRRPGIVAILKQGLTEKETRQAIRELNAAITLDEIKAAVEWLKTNRKN